MLSKSSLALACGILFGIACMFIISAVRDKEPLWLGDLDTLGLVDRLGNRDADLHLLVVTSNECYPCMETMRLVFPKISQSLYDGDIQFTIVTISPNTEFQRTLLEAKKRVYEIDPNLLIVLNEYLVSEYSAIDSDDVDSNKLLRNMGLNIENEITGIDWAERINASLKVFEEVGISNVPLWFINFKRINGTPKKISEIVENAVNHIE